MRLLVLPVLLAIAGCGGGSQTGDLGGEQGAISAATASFAVVDLASRGLEYRVDVGDLAANPAYRDQQLVFRRVGSGSSAAFVAVFELTQAQWTRIAGDSPWQTVPAAVVPLAAQAGDRPAYNLDHASIVSALVAFPLAAGGHLALPTAAQWRLAAGASTGWSWGDALDGAALQASAVVRETTGGIAGPRAVGGRQAVNGFHDLHGNVWEWMLSGTEVRGGSWHDPAWSSRAEIAAGTGQGLASEVDHALIGARLVLYP